jgi:hypothetical protein
MVASATANAAQIVSQDVTPVNAALFPWLNNIAGSFEEYRILKFTVKHEPLVSATTAGYVALAFSYNAQDAVPTDESTFFTYKTAVRNSIWQTCSTSLRATKWLYTQPPTLPAEYDLKTFQAGKLFMMCATDTANMICGQVFYDVIIEFRKPRKTLYTPSSAGTTAIHASNVHSQKEVFSNEIDFGNDQMTKYSDSAITFETPGRYIMPAAFMLTDSTGTTTAAEPADATIRSQLKDVRVGFVKGDDTLESDATRATMGLSTNPVGLATEDTNNTYGGGQYSWLVDVVKPDTTVDVATKDDESEADWWNSSSGWGTLWDAASGALEVVETAAPYVMQALSFFLSEEDEEYARRRALGFYEDWHNGRKTVAPALYVPNKLRRNCIFPEDLWFSMGLKPCFAFPEIKDLDERWRSHRVYIQVLGRSDEYQPERLLAIEMSERRAAKNRTDSKLKLDEKEERTNVPTSRCFLCASPLMSNSGKLCEKCLDEM